MARSHRILILFAHPALEKSRVNRRLIQAVTGLAGVTIHDLYEAYPDFYINVKREQELLVTHDIVVFQHPFYWYSSPAILKEWQDLVLEYGFAYGHEGTALRGKKFLSAITTGGSEQAYSREGHNYFTVRELLVPFEQTARLCGMEYLPPFVIQSTHQLGEKQELTRHIENYYKAIVALRDDAVDWERLRQSRYFNHDLAQQLPAQEATHHG
ncbi:MAG: NAD(P)H-dependent oxidoreductase [Aphanocapsa lilacina HA4352-LM1]|jgi:glutathione-regulated potassium-efflux system ancillary protein KefG|nr:NAD(P)H-dependent oxidoreductase [Aphanocapsa lilacina HA4352-LM1]